MPTTGYGRYTNLGRPKVDTVDVNVKVDEVIEAALKPLQGAMEELLVVLKQTRDGTGFITGTDLGEQEVE